MHELLERLNEQIRYAYLVENAIKVILVIRYWDDKLPNHAVEGCCDVTEKGNRGVFGAHLVIQIPTQKRVRNIGTSSSDPTCLCDVE